MKKGETKNKYERERYRAPEVKEAVRRTELLRRYGLTLKNYDKLLMEQGGECGICHTTECVTGKALAVDHCHDTGQVRGLLCYNVTLVWVNSKMILSYLDEPLNGWKERMPRVKNPLKILYLDIETTPHEGSFWNLFPKFISISMLKRPTEMLCWAAKWDGEKDVEFKKMGDEGFVERIHTLLDEADAVVHYNGKAFDIKHLNREFALVGLGPPSPFHQIDLLTAVRGNFKLPSNKLDYVCRYFGLGQKVEHAGIELWFDCMEGDEGAWKIMEKYNRRDVILLPKLYKFLRPWIKNHPNSGLASEPTRPVCPTCSSTNVQSRGTYSTKSAVYERFFCTSCSTWSRRRQQLKPTSENVLTRAN